MFLSSDVFPYGIYMLAYEQILTSLRKIQEVATPTAVEAANQNNRSEMLITVIAGSVAGKFFLKVFSFVLYYLYFRIVIMGSGHPI